MGVALRLFKPTGHNQAAMLTTDSTLPCVLAGPILRRVQARSITLWLATSRAQRVRVDLTFDGRTTRSLDPAVQTLQAGASLHYLLMELHLEEDLPAGRWTGYRVWLADVTEPPAIAAPWIEATDASLCYAGRSTPGFVYQPRLRALLHGSCRKPHHAEGDGLVRADSHMACLATSEPNESWPAALVLTGDQVYCDDVAGPMLRAIHALVARLGLPDEALPGAEVTGTHALHRDGANYYNRASLLPQGKAGSRVVDLFFGGVRKPVFSTDNAENHLVSLAEVLAMYLLVWSPVCWQGLDLSPPPGLSPASGARYVHERQAIESFVAGLAAVRRVLAHVPTAMIFDDHDITDDWNLNREWEEAAYGHDFSRRIIGNALIGYLVHQAWGNDPQAFDTAWMGKLRDVLQGPGGGLHDSLIDELLHWRVWHYSWPTTPPLMVTDGRTHRWRSEVSPRRPSGLMD
jgi:hypothetical protein